MSAALLPARVRMRPDGTPEVPCGRRDGAANVMDPDEPRLLRPGFIWGADGAWSLSARAERQWAEAKRGDNALLVALARDLSMRDAAKAAGLSERTAYRR